MMTPIHPNLQLDRPMTEDEFIEAIEYEGMFGVTDKDLPVALELKHKGLIILEFWDKTRGWHACTLN